LLYGDIPNWLKKLQRKIGWFSLPNLALYIIVLQIFGFLTLQLRQDAIFNLFLIPELVLQGEFWRLFTFMAVPLSSGFWMIFVILFLYFVINTLEKEWGEFYTTFYLFISVALTIAFSFLFHMPITSFSFIESTLFLAVATMFPEYEILMLFFPVKMKWMGFLTAAYIGYVFLTGEFLDKVYLILVFTNYFIFFGPAFIHKIKQTYRRKKFQNRG